MKQKKGRKVTQRLELSVIVFLFITQ
jgi:hypothetical protein